MGRPIENRVGAVFLHVTDMARAIDWYTTLLGVAAAETSHEGLIYDVPIRGETGLILDGHAHARGEWSPPPSRCRCSSSRTRTATAWSSSLGTPRNGERVPALRT